MSFLMCKRPNANKRNIIRTGLTNEEKKKIIDVHNELRQKIATGKESRGKPGPQPAAKSMPPVEWDNKLAQLAQKWADQCEFGHDKNRVDGRFMVGQNVALLGTNKDIESLKAEEMVKLWYDEVALHPKSNAAKFSATYARECGHYTQLVWAKSTLIGCGAVKYEEEGIKRFYLVCNYGPAGNVVGAPIYEVA